MHLDLLRSFLLVLEQGSLNKAAARLRLSQSTLTRQMRALEQELGGPLFERSPGGMALTATGHAFAKDLAPALGQLEAALGAARRLARGQSASLRIGYIVSAAADYLNPALAALRREHPEVKVTLLDLSPGEQLAALAAGELDLALFGHPGPLRSTDFYLRRVASFPVWAALGEQHPLAARRAIALAELRNEPWIGAAERDLPGFNRWLVQLGRRARFRPRFVADADSLSHSLSLVVTEGAVVLLPSYAANARAPGVVYRPLADAAITWDLSLAWQRGRLTVPVKFMLGAIAAPGAAAGRSDRR